MDVWAWSALGPERRRHVVHRIRLGRHPVRRRPCHGQRRDRADRRTDADPHARPLRAAAACLVRHHWRARHEKNDPDLAALARTRVPGHRLRPERRRLPGDTPAAGRRLRRGRLQPGVGRAHRVGGDGADGRRPNPRTMRRPGGHTPVYFMAAHVSEFDDAYSLSRGILAVVAMGRTPYAFGGRNLVSGAAHQDRFERPDRAVPELDLLGRAGAASGRTRRCRRSLNFIRSAAVERRLQLAGRRGARLERHRGGGDGAAQPDPLRVERRHPRLHATCTPCSEATTATR